MLLPARCPICDRRGPAPCGACAAALVPAPALPAPPGLDGCAAVLAYEDGGAVLLTALKYRNSRSAVRWLAWQMARRVRPDSLDAVTWAPTGVDRRRQRGFDQAALLARAVAGQLDVPARDLLVRRPGVPQTGRSHAERWTGPAFGLRPGAAVPPRVLVVDDVVTTGATLAAASRTLRAGGATQVWAVAGARTPFKRRSARTDVVGDGRAHEPYAAPLAGRRAAGPGGAG